MKRTSPLEAGLASALVIVLALVAASQVFESRRGGAASDEPPITPEQAADETHPAYLHGRVTTEDGATFEGRLRFGRHEEAYWTDLFDGRKAGNPWAASAPSDRLVERRPVELLGLELMSREHEIDLGRPFRARFGDLERIESVGRDVRVTVRSGATFVLDLHEAGDFDDGVRVWDGQRGRVDLSSGSIRTIEFLPGERRAVDPERLFGTVRTRRSATTGFVQWGTHAGLGSNVLLVRTVDGEQSLRFDTIRSFARHDGGCTVALSDGQELALPGDGAVEAAPSALFVDDPLDGRVRVPWDALVRVDFEVEGSGAGGPAYGDFPPGRALAGTVTTRGGERLAGRLVIDLDESDTAETLDAPEGDVDRSIPFGRVASIVLAGPGLEEGLARVTLVDGSELRLGREGDLGPLNAGVLVFADGAPRPTYVDWREVERIEFEQAIAVAPVPEDG